MIHCADGRTQEADKQMGHRFDGDRANPLAPSTTIDLGSESADRVLSLVMEEHLLEAKVSVS